MFLCVLPHWLPQSRGTTLLVLAAVAVAAALALEGPCRHAGVHMARGLRRAPARETDFVTSGSLHGPWRRTEGCALVVRKGPCAAL